MKSIFQYVFDSLSKCISQITSTVHHFACMYINIQVPFARWVVTVPHLRCYGWCVCVCGMCVCLPILSRLFRFFSVHLYCLRISCHAPSLLLSLCSVRHCFSLSVIFQETLLPVSCFFRKILIFLCFLVACSVSVPCGVLPCLVHGLILRVVQLFRGWQSQTHFSKLNHTRMKQCKRSKKMR